MVRTTNRSIAAIPAAWLRRNVLQPCERGLGGLIIYLPTVDPETSNPNIISSPWMRGASHSRFSRLILRIRARRSDSIVGLPLQRKDFHRQ